MQAAVVQFYRLHAANHPATRNVDTCFRKYHDHKDFAESHLFTVHRPSCCEVKLLDWGVSGQVRAHWTKGRGCHTRVPTAASSFKWSVWAEPPSQTCRSSQRGAATGSTSSWKSASRPPLLTRLHDQCLPSCAPRPSQWNQGSAWAIKSFSTSTQLKRRSSLQYHHNNFIHIKPNINTTESYKGLNERIIPSPSLAHIGSS
jgi:hypothetical protein